MKKGDIVLINEKELGRHEYSGKVLVIEGKCTGCANCGLWRLKDIQTNEIIVGSHFKEEWLLPFDIKQPKYEIKWRII